MHYGQKVNSSCIILVETAIVHGSHIEVSTGSFGDIGLNPKIHTGAKHDQDLIIHLQLFYTIKCSG